MDGFEYGQSFKWLLWFLLLEYGFMATLLEPGFLDFDNLPDTNFTCVGKVIGGYYADLETACQMFHVCTIGQLDEPMDIRFLCLNGTVFDQETRVCERIDEVDCAKSEQFYSLNLELYGNTQAPILPESEEEEEPSHNNGHATTSTSRTSSASSDAKVTRQSFIITTARPTKTTELYKPHTTPKALTTIRYQIPINRPPDFRFNPKEINVSLNVRGTAHTEHYHPHHHYNDEGTSSTERLIEHFKISDTSQRSPSKFVRNNPKPTVRTTTTTEDVNLYHQTETEHFVDFQKEPSHQPLLRNNYQYRLNVPNFRPSATGLLRHHQQNKYSHTNRPSIFYSPPKNQQQYKNQQQRLSILQPSQSYYNNYRNQHQDYSPTELPPAKIQLDIPTRQPLTFSSPAPFRLSSQSKDHTTTNHRQYVHQSPRIVISASASVSDASGRKFNYSLGTIGDSQLFGHAPQSYDDYREEDVGFDPFYHDVLKLNRGGRRKRETPQSSTDAIDTLRFLFEWYNRHKTGDADLINAMWNEGQNLSESKNYSVQRNDDVIYKSVLDTIKQEDPANAMSNNYEDFDYSALNVDQAAQSKDYTNNYEEDLTNYQNDDDRVQANEKAIDPVDAHESDDKDNTFGNMEIVTVKNHADVVTAEDKEEVSFTSEDYVTVHKHSDVAAEDEEEISFTSQEYVTVQNRSDVTAENKEVEVSFTSEDYVPQNYELKFESKPFSKMSLGDAIDSTTVLPNASEDIDNISSQNQMSTTIEFNEQITEKYLQVLNILGITTNKKDSNEFDATTRNTEEVLDIPTDASTESLLFATETTSQIYTTTDKEETFTANIENEEKTFVGSTIFGAKLMPSSTTHKPIVYTKPTLEDSLLITTTEESVTEGNNSLEIVDIIPTLSAIPTTITALPKTVENTLFRTSNHRFNRFRNKPQRSFSGKVIHTSPSNKIAKNIAQETTTTTTKSSYFKEAAEMAELSNPKLVSQTFSLKTKNATVKSIADTPMKEMLKNYIFNCFGKDLNQFYSDPRDCRLFHYCTNGFTSTQLLDMKFVCDLGTFFDNEKLVCTKNKPSRCI